MEPYQELKKRFSSTSLAFAYKDTLDVLRKANLLIGHLHAKGHFTAANDSIVLHGDTLVAYLFLGPMLKEAFVDSRAISQVALRKTGLSSLFPEVSSFSPKEFFKAEKKLVDYYQNIGFPFALVYLDSIIIQESRLRGKLQFSQGPFIVFDSLHIAGKTKTRKKFLGNYTRIRNRDPFSQTTIDQAYKLIKQLPYLRVQGEPTVTFVMGKAYVTFYIEDRKANQVDGVAGFLPNQQNDPAAEKKLLVTGEFNMVLKNMAGKGKGLSVQWKRLKPESQQLDLEYFHPNLFNSPMNVVPSFNLLKQDTTFQTLSATLKTTFNLTGSARMGFYLGTKQSRLLSTKQYSNYSKPPFLDYSLNTYGVDYEWNNLDDYFYPLKGNWVFVDGNVGMKNITPNKRLPEVLYTDIKRTTTQFFIKGELRHFTRLGRRNTVLASLRGARVFNDNVLLTNDLLQVGGLKTIRGFNENYFFAEYYSTGTLEFRQFTDESSYLLLFAEQSFMNYRLGTDQVDDWPIGLGAGLSLSTNSGVFNFVYSLGQAKTQQLQFNQSKVHFGYITRF